MGGKPCVQLKLGRCMRHALVAVSHQIERQMRDCIGHIYFLTRCLSPLILGGHTLQLISQDLDQTIVKSCHMASVENKAVRVLW